MKRGMIVLGLSALLAAPAAAQWAGMPVWNNPKGGTGITISGDYGKPDNNSGGGSAFGARGSLGLGNLTLTAGLDSYKPSGGTSATSVGGNVGFRVIGGSLIPIAVNLQGGAASTSASGNTLTTAIAAVGVSVNLPTPGLNIEPYISPGLRYSKASGVSGNSNFGFALGVNVGLGMLGFHAAYDYTKIKASLGGGHSSTIGIGAHIALKAPVGM